MIKNIYKYIIDSLFPIRFKVRVVNEKNTIDFIIQTSNTRFFTNYYDICFLKVIEGRSMINSTWYWKVNYFTYAEAVKLASTFNNAKDVEDYYDAQNKEEIRLDSEYAEYMKINAPVKLKQIK